MGSSERDRNFSLGRDSATMANQIGDEQQARIQPVFDQAMAIIQQNLSTQVQPSAAPGSEFIQGAAKRSGANAEGQQKAQLAQNTNNAQGNYQDANLQLGIQQNALATLASLIQASQQVPLAQMGVFTQGADFQRQQAASTVGDMMGLGQGLGQAGFQGYNAYNDKASRSTKAAASATSYPPAGIF